MKLAYAHTSRDSEGRMQHGLVFAGSAAEAHFRLRRQFARDPLSIRLAPLHTLALWLQPAFAQGDLAAFYRALGRRLERGEAIQPGLLQAQAFIADARLVQAVGLLAHGLREGQALGRALRMAGFPDRDAAALEAVAETGRLPDTLLVLAQDVERRARLAQAMQRTLQMPLTVLALLYAGLYLALVLFLPTMARFYQALGAANLPALASQLFALAGLAARHRALVTTVWALLPLLAWLALRTALARTLWQRLPPVERWLACTELASLWSGFATLYDAGVQVEEACRLLQAAATRPAVQRCFAALARELRGGWPLVQAVVRAGFPPRVVRAVQAADTGGDLVAGLRLLAQGLAEDVEQLGARQEHLLRVAATLVAAGLIGGFFLLTYYPILSSTFSQL